MADNIWLAIAFPLAGVVINGLAGRRLSRRIVSLLGCGTIALAFLVIVGAFLQLSSSGEESLIVHLYDWIPVGTFAIPVEFRIDPLSMVMALVVSGIGLLIHIYSIGYMAEDDLFSRFFTYLNLFMACMLTLVLANNYLLLFVGWEGVGLCSYLLIGFWFHKPSAADAGRKAFVVNRVGDFGFALGMLLIYKLFGSLNYDAVLSHPEHVIGDQVINVAGFGIAAATLIPLLLFVGATGKSAQIPLFIWLPDAMEGPTPVSALIHAATMVTAGVYMVARSHALFLLSPVAMSVVAIIGALTALLAATIALVQNDIKRVLAYSTVSQLGYMFLGCGVGAFGAAIFHVYTHAFFKALLFLGSGSVIHAMEHAFHHAGVHDDPQDMNNMGGLMKYMPATGKTFVIGAAALAGLPFISGFWSKDEILAASFTPHAHIAGGPMLGKALWFIGLTAAVMTAFYMTRQCIKVFYGRERFDTGKVHVHESPAVMTAPLWVLALGAIAAGWIGIPGKSNLWEHYLEPVFAHGEAAAHPDFGLIIVLMLLAIGGALLGFLVAKAWFSGEAAVPKQVAARYPGLYRLLWRKWFVDELYEATIVRAGYALSDFSAWVLDAKGVDGLVNGVAKAIGAASGCLRRLQTSFVRQYALVMALGGFLLILYFTLR